MLPAILAVFALVIHLLSRTPFAVALPSNASDATSSTNLTPGSSPANYYIPFGPLQAGIFCVQGTYDPEKRFRGPYDVADLLDHSIQSFLSECVQSLRAPRGRQEVFYDGEDGEVKILVEWLMDGRDGALTYGECLQAIYRFLDLLQQRRWLNRSPVQAVILRQGQRKILITVTVEVGEQVNLNPGQTLVFKGDFWPRRRISLQTIRILLDGVLSDVRDEDPHDLVPLDWSIYKRRRRVDILFLVEGLPIPEQAPRFTFDHLKQLFEAIGSFYQNRRIGGELRGAIFCQSVGLGIFNVQLFPFRSIIPMNSSTAGNGTQQVLENSESSINKIAAAVNEETVATS